MLCQSSKSATVAQVLLGKIVFSCRMRAHVLRWWLKNYCHPMFGAPSYLCHTILSGIDANRVRFYPVNYDLKTDPDYWMDKVNKDDLVIFIDYFGWLCSRDCIASIKSRGAWVLEDACQALLTDGVGELADFVVFSPRKFLGIPDGRNFEQQCKER